MWLCTGLSQSAASDKTMLLVSGQPIMTKELFLKNKVKGNKKKRVF